MIGKASAVFLLCLLKHTVSVPMSEFFEETGTFITLGPDEQIDCGGDLGLFVACNADRSRVCVSFYLSVASLLLIS